MSFHILIFTRSLIQSFGIKEFWRKYHVIIIKAEYIDLYWQVNDVFKKKKTVNDKSNIISGLVAF